jgi:hypothetical protein
MNDHLTNALAHALAADLQRAATSAQGRGSQRGIAVRGSKLLAARGNDSRQSRRHPRLRVHLHNHGLEEILHEHDR